MGNFASHKRAAKGRRIAHVRPSMKPLVPALLMVGTLLVMLAPPAMADHLPEGAGHPGTLFRPAVQSSRGVVASTSNLASEAGLAILEDGGNAMDAAVATVFAVGVTRPDMCGIGGGGFLVYRSAEGEVAALDFRETAPAGYNGGRGIKIGTAPAQPTVALTGHNVAGVPGTVAGMAEALARYGSISLAEAVAPAERLARIGFPVHADMEISYGLAAHRLALFEETAKIYLLGGVAPYPPGVPLVQTDYAHSLRLIAVGGADAFYRGPIAEMIVRDMETNDSQYEGDTGVMTMEDLAGYRAVWRVPLQTTYRGDLIVTMPEPTGGGIALVEALNILENFDLRASGRNSADHLHVLAETLKIAFVDYATHAADRDFYPVPNQTLTSKEYARQRWSEIDMARAKGYGSFDASEGGDTTHVSVIDSEGNAVAVTCSMETTFGSAVVPPGAGFLLNNQLTDFNAHGSNDPFMFPTSAANDPAPGKRPRSAMTPAIVVRDGEVILAVGAAGGPRIIPAVIQAVINTLDFDMDVAEALDAERIREVRNNSAPTGTGPRDYPQALDMVVEDARISASTKLELRNRSHGWDPAGEYEIVVSARAQGAGRDLATGEPTAASDSRREGGSAAANELPIAAGAASTIEADRVSPVHFTDLSSDEDGHIVAWRWDFGDGTSSTEQHPRHQYARLGKFEVTLTVTDNHVNNFSACCRNGASVSTHVATIKVKNLHPHAEANGHGGHGQGILAQDEVIEANRITPLEFQDQSTDSDGYIAAWRWDFGDGATSVEQNPAHQYTQLGTFTVRLTATDNDGDSGSSERTVRVVNLLPTAAFEVDPAHPMVLALTDFLDSSTDPDGAPAAWGWAFGDGDTAKGAEVSHRYLEGGWYTVRLAIADNDGGAAETTVSVYVCSPGGDATTLLDPSHIRLEFEACIHASPEEMPRLLPMGFGGESVGALPGLLWALAASAALVARRVRPRP